MRRRNFGEGAAAGRRAAQERRDRSRPLHSRHTDLAFAIQVLPDFALLRLVGHAHRVQLVMVPQFVRSSCRHRRSRARRAGSSTPRAPRSSPFPAAGPCVRPFRFARVLRSTPARSPGAGSARVSPSPSSTRRALSELQNVLFHVDVQRGMIGLFELQGVALASAGRPQVVDGAVARHGQQPRADGALLRVEALRAIPHAQKCFLHQVFGDARRRARRAGSASRPAARSGRRAPPAPADRGAAGARSSSTSPPARWTASHMGRNIISKSSSPRRFAKPSGASIVYTREPRDQDLADAATILFASRERGATQLERVETDRDMHFSLDFLREQPYI